MTIGSSMHIQSSKAIERWELFQELSVRVVSMVASEFPKPVPLKLDELLGSLPPVDRNEQFTCVRTLESRRDVRKTLASELAASVANQALCTLMDEACSPSAERAQTDEWKAEWLQAVDAEVAKVAANPMSRVVWEIRHASALKDAPAGTEMPAFEPANFVKIQHLAVGSNERKSRITDALAAAILALQPGLGEPLDETAVRGLADHIASDRLDQDLALASREAMDWLTSTDRLPGRRQPVMDLLEQLTQVDFDLRCAESVSCAWQEVEAIRNRHLQRQDRSETLTGTVDYLLEARILLKRTIDDEDLYTLSPEMVAPLMAAKASGSGESGFAVLSKLREGGAEAFKELAKEAASILFTAATVGIGKLAMGA